MPSERFFAIRHRIAAARDHEGGFMKEDRNAKYGAASGIVFIVLMVIGFLVVAPTPPNLDASVDEWSAYYTDHHDAINAAVVVITVSLFFFIWFLGSLASALRVAAGSPRLPSIAFGGGLLAIVSLFVALTAAAAAAHRPDQVSPEATRVLHDLSLMAGVPGIAGFAALFAATAVVILRGSLLPHWLGWLSAVAAVLQPLGFGLLFTDTGAFAADGVLGLFVPFAVGIVTIVALSIVLIQTAEELNRSIGITDRVRGAVTGAAAGAQGQR
jgi:hypothetical protein